MYSSSPVASFARVTSLGILAVAFAACATTKPEPISVPPFSFSDQEQLGVERVFIVTDASSSMRPGRLGEARALTQSVVAGLPEPTGSEPYDVSLISFGGTKQVASPLAPLDRAALSQQASQIESLGDIPLLGGTTPMHRVFDGLEGQVEGTTGRSAVVLISDGRPGDPDRTLAAAKQLRDSSPGGICFHAIQVGASGAGREFSEELSALTDCGSARTAAQIATATDVANLERRVFAVAATTLPPVAAGPPCDRTATLDGEVHFGFDTAELNANGRMQVDWLAVQLSECDTLRVKIEGHTDGTGADAYNAELSERRAETVRQELIGAGISPDRLVVEAYGDANPFTSNDTLEGRRANRRVQLEPIR